MAIIGKTRQDLIKFYLRLHELDQLYLVSDISGPPFKITWKGKAYVLFCLVFVSFDSHVCAEVDEMVL
jgi:hypothetical protein